MRARESEQARPLTDKERKAKQPPITGDTGPTVFVGGKRKIPTVAEMVDSLVKSRARRF